jgi:hypothetical protein
LKVVSEMLGHTTTAITADLYTHVLGDLKADAADRLYAIFQRAEKLRAVGAESGAWAKCGLIERPNSKKPSKIRPDVVAPTGVEPVYRGPGRSRRIPDSPFLYGFSRFRAPASPDESRRVLRNPLDGR